MKARWSFVRACAPIIELLPQWWRVRAYNRLAGRPYQQGSFGGQTAIRSLSPHGFQMVLHLDDWMERQAALTGAFYAIDATATLAKLLRPGDIFVDVGANIGFLTLTAASLVSPSGRVVAVEPNPVLAARLKDHIDRNCLRNIDLHQCALGDKTGSALLSVGAHHGSASLRHGASGDNRSEPGTTEIAVDVRVGDELVSNLRDDQWCLAKIDVEGFEERVLHGFPQLISRRRTAFLVEVTDEWLRALGGSANSLISTMRDAGYSAFKPHVTPWGQLRLTEIADNVPTDYQYDVVFMRAHDSWHEHSLARNDSW